LTSPATSGAASGAQTAVLWFRRDLRLHDHPALADALATADRIAPLFVLDPTLITGRWRSPNRTWFMLASLAELAASLEAAGSVLVVRVGRPELVVPAFAAEVGARTVHVSRDYAPYGRARDGRVAEALRQIRVALHAAPGNLIHEPEDLATRSGTPYRVFGPFHRAWSTLPVRAPLAAPAVIPTVPFPAHAPSAVITADARILAWVTALRELGAGAADPDDLEGPTADPGLVPDPGEPAARLRLARWTRAAGHGPPRVLDYRRGRDLLGVDGTSRLSQDLRWGLLSPIEVVSHVLAAGQGPGVERFVAELAWRDFYTHVLWHDPESARRATRRDYDAVPWRDDPGAVEAWSNGSTGYPVVDDAMRQLRATGWMHNRARMIAASFLTKDLLVDWRVGEAWFMRHLLDGDPASNNGGWQWAASTGTDAQPYFRVFHPVAQGRRFDADGAYVRRWVPELDGVPVEYLHAPWTMPDAAQAASRCRIGIDYPAPIVDHRDARRRAIEAYASVRGGRGPHDGPDSR
jgi:deoxyribodipyrimidine photo-lyase